MLFIQKKDLKNYLDKKYILLLRTTLDDLVEIMNELDKLSDGQYEPLGDVKTCMFFDYVIMKRK